MTIEVCCNCRPMEITSLSKLMGEGCVAATSDGLVITIQPSWVITGEDRLSYTTLIRLIECCREHHWQDVILPLLNSLRLDSICKKLTADFIRPVLVGSTISITHEITEVRRKGYSLKFMIYDIQDIALCAEFDLISVFYDPLARTSVTPPPAFLKQLSSLAAGE